MSPHIVSEWLSNQLRRGAAREEKRKTYQLGYVLRPALGGLKGADKKCRALTMASHEAVCADVHGMGLGLRVPDPTLLGPTTLDKRLHLFQFPRTCQSNSFLKLSKA